MARRRRVERETGFEPGATVLNTLKCEFKSGLISLMDVPGDTSFDTNRRALS